MSRLKIYFHSVGLTWVATTTAISHVYWLFGCAMFLLGAYAIIAIVEDRE